jgi:flagellar biosynthesis/type III secretory pathway protein FliH
MSNELDDISNHYNEGYNEGWEHGNDEGKLTGYHDGYFAAMDFVLHKILTEYMGKQGEVLDSVLRQLRQELIDIMK